MHALQPLLTINSNLQHTANYCQDSKSVSTVIVTTESVKSWSKAIAIHNDISNFSCQQYV